jgi:hypothetical protein
MNAETWFTIANVSVLPGWGLLVFAPRWKPGRWIAGFLLPAALGVLYVTLFLLHLGAAEGGFGSLAGVGALFSDPWLLLVGWVHYLAFDLFVGSWEVREAQRSGLPHLVVVPCLVLTFLAGPAGLLVFLLVRGIWKRRWTIEGDASSS